MVVDDEIPSSRKLVQNESRTEAGTTFHSGSLGGGGAFAAAEVATRRVKRRMKNEGQRAVVRAFILHHFAFILSHTSLNCGVKRASKNSRISLAAFFEINSRGDSSYQSVGKNCV